MPVIAENIRVIRRPERFSSDDRRVITRFFHMSSDDRINSIIQRVLSMDEHQVDKLLEQVLSEFDARHRKIELTLERHFHQVRSYIADPDAISRNRQLLIGSYFTMEYSIESAALFNPSIVLHPDQSGLRKGTARFIMSLRATGEGHVSSIVFRTGTVDAAGRVDFDPPSRYAARLRVRGDKQYEKKLFFLKLIEMAAYSDAVRAVLDDLPDFFTFEQLDRKLNEVAEQAGNDPIFKESSENMLWLARSNYQLELPPESDPSDIVIFPTSQNESKGIEDLRLTRFIEDDGGVNYYGTYTAYNGVRILPQLLETKDFKNVKIHTLNGKYVQNKGMALFPRKIDGWYYMISRLDGENLFLMRSDNVHFWNECTRLQSPRHPWEFVQIGNCGPPIETEAGWLLLTHGVGPMRQYCIGASLLDRDNPGRVIGHLPNPLLAPEEHERDGYVPNVVYSCGALTHQDMLVLPYAMSDTSTSIAIVCLSDLLRELTRGVGALTPAPLQAKMSTPDHGRNNGNGRKKSSSPDSDRQTTKATTPIP